MSPKSNNHVKVKNLDNKWELETIGCKHMTLDVNFMASSNILSHSATTKKYDIKHPNENRLSQIGKIREPWNEQNNLKSNDQIRVLLKKTYFYVQLFASSKIINCQTHLIICLSMTMGLNGRHFN